MAAARARDRDGSPRGRDPAGRGSVRSRTARPEGIARQPDRGAGNGDRDSAGFCPSGPLPCSGTRVATETCVRIYSYFHGPRRPRDTCPRARAAAGERHAGHPDAAAGGARPAGPSRTRGRRGAAPDPGRRRQDAGRVRPVGSGFGAESGRLTEGQPAAQRCSAPNSPPSLAAAAMASLSDGSSNS